MKKKNVIKRTIALILCVIIAVTASNVQDASAATKKLPLKVAFNGKNGKKTAAIVKDLNKDHDGATIKTLKSKWGNPKKEGSDGFYTYTWKKGKTEISVMSVNGGNYAWNIGITIDDKNGSLFGVTVGTKKSNAIKKLEKALGTKATVTKGNEWQNWDEIVEIPTPNDMAIVVGLNNGKVAHIGWGRS